LVDVAHADVATTWSSIGIDNIKAAGGPIAGPNRAPRVSARSPSRRSG
jgi:hypothetical protein